jgi:glycine hydroxymethyltransferase
MQPEFVDYQRRVMTNAKALASALAREDFRIVSKGTDSHMMLVDVFAKGVRGKEAEHALDEAFITANKNAIPFDQNPPLNPSGIRLGTPAVTTRGFGESEMSEIASCIAQVLADPAGASTIAAVRRRVQSLTERFPLYSWKMSAVSA